MGISVIITQILAGIQAAINAAPQIEGIVTSAKALFASLFESGLISVDLQNATHAYVDAIAAMKRNGIVPPQWQVEPDPVTPAATVSK